MDVKGKIWLALWGGWAVIQFDFDTGTGKPYQPLHFWKVKPICNIHHYCQKRYHDRGFGKGAHGRLRFQIVPWGMWPNSHSFCRLNYWIVFYAFLS